MKLDAVFSPQRLVSAPSGSLTQYQLSALGELKFSELDVPIKLSLTCKESGVMHQSLLELCAEVEGHKLEEKHEFPPASGDCWTMVDCLCGASSDPALQSVLSTFVARVCTALNRPMVRILESLSLTA